MKWKELSKDVLGYKPKSKAECLEKTIEKFVIPLKTTCGPILYISRQEIPKHYSFLGEELPSRVVLDSNVLGRIIKRSYCMEYEFWKNGIKIIENIENGRMEGKILKKSLIHIDKIFNQTNFKTNDPKVKELIKKTIFSTPHLGVKNDPKIDSVKNKYWDVINNYNLKAEDIEDLAFAYVADKEAAFIITYDTFLLSEPYGLPKSFTPEELLGYKIPTERCKTFCEHAQKAKNAIHSLNLEVKFPQKIIGKK